MTCKKILVVLLLWPLLLAGCGDRDKNGDGMVIIGSKNFTEQFILAEIMAQLIEAHTELTVRRTFNLGGTMICHQALLEGAIDLYPEYTGTALSAILNEDPGLDADEALELVRTRYRREFGVDWLDPFGFNNTYALTVRAAEAAEHGWQSIGDLAAAAGDLQAGFTAEFIERSDGYPGLRQAYGLNIGGIRDMDPGLMYQAIAAGNVDVISAFSTDGRIPAYQLQPLIDDRGFFPPYYAAPLLRNEVARRYPEVPQTLALLAGAINNATMQRLNHQVDEEKKAIQKVATAFLNELDLI
ncbi:glycine betaine ABC transporter substrate-binding protein [Desulfurivibrio dismutans]|uniref:glycine betaine ABC transporter substrate-binding protein n=1 Tax=Desulfurivibrio dismutans TaxID=1398908 RepID=UPI0023DC2B46|nr:glycine betaine ABC transporter substrate-binding protein [Desulfurivibrio alkaliphilus]MDF1615219.1 glycine betaine ABC transporter substrate-binding protein [Desulfurivibrio alkaliphilus]